MKNFFYHKVNFEKSQRWFAFKRLPLFLRKKYQKRVSQFKTRRFLMNKYINLRHMNFLFFSLLSTFRRLYYSRHIFICDYLIGLFKNQSNFLIGQGLVQRKKGFDNFKTFFLKMGAFSFLMSKKDIRYLRNYGVDINFFLNVIKGGFTFFVYLPSNLLTTERAVNNRGNKHGYNLDFFFKEIGVLQFLGELKNFVNFFDKQSLQSILFVKFYPLLIRYSGYFFIHDYFEIIYKKFQLGVNLVEFFTSERVKLSFESKFLANFFLTEKQEGADYLSSSSTLLKFIIQFFLLFKLLSLFQLKVNRLNFFLISVNKKISLVEKNI